MDGRWPDFFVVGANRAGTTSLHRHLGAHPDLFMSTVKEPSYFVYSGAELPRSSILRAFRHRLVLDAEQYRALFAAAGGRPAGEASSMYLDSPRAATRLRRTVADARIIISLRDPVACFESRVRALHALGVRRWDDLARDLAEHEAGRGDGDMHYYRYFEHVRRYLELFGADRVKVLLFDDFVADPRRLVRELYAFLGVDSSFVPEEIETPFNRYAAPDGLVPQEVRRRLGELTREDTEKLSALIGRDLGHWTCFQPL